MADWRWGAPARCFVWWLLIALGCGQVHSWGLWSWNSNPGRNPPSSPQTAVDILPSYAAFDLASEAIVGTEAQRDVIKYDTMGGSSPCWRSAYARLARSCKEILQDDDLKSRLAIELANCFSEQAGKPQLRCPRATRIKDCLSTSKDGVFYQTYMEFFIESASICHHLQTDAFQAQTERVVNDLKSTAHSTAKQLVQMGTQAGTILKQAQEAAAEQVRLRAEQGELRLVVEEGVGSIGNLTATVQGRVETLAELQAEQVDLAKASVTALHRVENHTHGIQDSVSASLAGQSELLAGQAAAQEGLTALRVEQGAALAGHTAALERLSEQARKQAEEVERWQREMGDAQRQLADKSAEIGKMQDEFAARQAAVLGSLARLFDLHSSLVAESMLVKSILFYTAATVLSVLLSATSRTADSRLPLFLGLSLNFAVEFAFARTIHVHAPILEVAAAIARTRAVFVTYAAAVLLYCLFSYKDYAALSFGLLEHQSRQLTVLEHRICSLEGPPPPLPQATGQPLPPSIPFPWLHQAPAAIGPVDAAAAARSGPPTPIPFAGVRGAAVEQGSGSGDDDVEWQPKGWTVVEAQCGGSTQTVRHNYNLRPRKGPSAAASSSKATLESLTEFYKIFFRNALAEREGFCSDDGESESDVSLEAVSEGEMQCLLSGFSCQAQETDESWHGSTTIRVAS